MATVMVSLPDDLLAALDEEASRRSTSTSALLATAARREISWTSFRPFWAHHW